MLYVTYRRAILIHVTADMRTSSRYICGIVCCLPPLFVDSARKDWVERRIDIFRDVLDDERLPVGNGSLDVS